MSEILGRAEFFEQHPNARAWAALDQATALLEGTTPGPVEIPPGAYEGKRALVLGAGVAGLTTAYELLAQRSGMKVTVLEALNRTGGRCLSLRTGDTLTEDEDSELFESKPGETQVVRFERPVGDAEPYLNAGPGRLPSSHKRVLSYLRLFGVDVEVYVMNSESNLVQIDGTFDSEPVVYRRINHNVRGWLAEMVYKNAAGLLAAQGIAPEDIRERTKELQNLMISFGELTPTGDNIGLYDPTAGEDGLENARARAGFTVLPGVDAGVVGPAFSLDTLLASRFWSEVRFYQPVDFLWQPTLFQPVGGMDMVEHSFAQQVAALGGDIYLNSPVETIDWDPDAEEYVVQVRRLGVDEPVEYRADYVFSNIAVPFLSRLVSDRLQDPATEGGFSTDFKAALHAVYKGQFEGKAHDDGFVERFLANTTKVGWQADRTLWQGTPVGTPPAGAAGELEVPGSEVGVVPIFGGISWTKHDITQIWYPSDAYHDDLGVLTGAYNFSRIAARWGEMPIGDRLEKAREGARLFGKKFGDGLRYGVAIAWQNMPHIKGGWAQWHVVQNPVRHFNVLDQGTGVAADDHEGYTDGPPPTFFVVGDQVSSLPGWQEGAIASALNALFRLVNPGVPIAELEQLPDTRLMVEGV